MKSLDKTTKKEWLVMLLIGAMLLVSSPVGATPHPGQSVNVAIIGSPGVINGGTLPTIGPVGELGDFNFTNLAPGAVNATNLAAFDTVVLNVASVQMGCNVNTLTASQKAALVTFVGTGKKMIIYDSECSPQNYSWLPFPFNTSNPGAMGAFGTLTIVEENTLSSNNVSNPHFINAPFLGNSTDAVGDMNVMTTFDPNWCVDMSGTNFLGVTGPVHTYAKYPTGTDTGLFIYNGLDVDFMGFEPSPPAPNGLRKIWVQELQQPFNPSNLPCGVTVVGITLTPPNATNEVGQTHTVTATLIDLLGNPQPGVTVNFSIISGPNSPSNGSAMTNASGQATFTYTGTGGVGMDNITACFNQAGTVVCSQVATKEWTALPELIEGRMTGGGSVFNASMRVTHGFELNCNASKVPNNLQVNWGKGNKFHLESLTTASCSDDPAITPNPPAAGFDTYVGTGTGRYNGVSGYTAEWTFTDAGEPGKNDLAKIVIKDASSNVILSVSGNLTNGNQQAHKE